MYSTLVDLTKVLVTNASDVAFTLGAASFGYRGTESLTDGSTYSYSIQQDGDYETGTGIWVAATGQLTRVPRYSSNGGGAVSFTGTFEISFVASASDLTALQFSDPAFAAAVQAAAQAVLSIQNNAGIAAVVLKSAGYNSATKTYKFTATRTISDLSKPVSFGWAVNPSPWSPVSVSPSDFNGQLPRGVGTIPAGQTTTTFSFPCPSPVFPE